MTDQDSPNLKLNHEHLMNFLEATLPDGPGYGRRQVETTTNVDDIYQIPILRAGMPTQGWETLVTALFETSMTLEIHRWPGLADEPTTSVTLWASRYGIVQATTEASGITTLDLKPGGSLYKSVAQAVEIGPRTTAGERDALPLTTTFVENLFPGADPNTRRLALNQLAELTTPSMPDISQHLTAGQVTFLKLEIRMFCESGLRENALACMDTPAGFLIPLHTGGIFSRNKLSLTVMPPWAVWKNILELMPDGADVQHWHNLAKATADERVVPRIP